MKQKTQVMATNEREANAEAALSMARAFASLESAAEVHQLFAELLTPAEVRAIALRWLLLQRLEEGVTQRKIASELGISLCKITRGSKILKDRNSVTSRLIHNKITRKNQEQKR